MGLLSDEDFTEMGLKLPAQRRRLAQELRLFDELGAPHAEEVNPESLENFQKQVRELAETGQEEELILRNILFRQKQTKYRHTPRTQTVKENFLLPISREK